MCARRLPLAARSTRLLLPGNVHPSTDYVTDQLHLAQALQWVSTLRELCCAVQSYLRPLAACDWALLHIPEQPAWWWAADCTGQSASVCEHATSPCEVTKPVFASALQRLPAHVRAVLESYNAPSGRCAVAPLNGSHGGVLYLAAAESRRWTKGERIALALSAANLSLALDRVLIAEQAQVQARNAKLLDGIRSAIARTLDLEPLLHQVVEQVAQRYGYSLVSLYLLEEHELHCRHQVGYANVITTLPVTTGIMGRAVRERQSIWLPDVTAQPEFLAAVPDVVSEVAVPLQYGATVYGVLNIESTHGQRLGADDLALLEAVGAEVSVAIERAMLYTATRRQAQQLAVIERLRAAIASQLEPAALGWTIVRTLQEISQFDRVVLHLLQHDRLQPQSWIGTIRPQAVDLERDTSTLATCVQKRQPLLVNRPSTLDDHLIHSGMYVPLLYGDTILGALTIESSGVLAANDFEIVTALSEQIAATLEQNARIAAALRARQRESFIADLLSALNQAQPESWGELWSQLTVRLGELLNVQHCAISVIRAPSDDRLITWSADETHPFGTILRALPQAVYDSMVAGMVKHRSLVCVGDFTADPIRSPFRASLAAQGIAAMVIVPVLVDQTLEAMIGVFHDQPCVWAHEDLALLEVVAQHVAVALRQAELRAQEAQRRDELALVYQTAIEINAQRDLEALLQAIVDRACMLLNADSATVYLLLNAQEAELRVGVNLPPELIGSRMRVDQGLIGRALASARSYYVPNYRAWPDRDERFTFDDFGATLGVPLLVGERAIGVITIAHLGDRQFRRSDQRLIELLAAQAALAIETAQLLDESRRHTREMEAVYANALDLAAQPEPSQVLRSIAERASTLVRAATVGIHLLDRETHDLELVVGVNLVADLIGTRITLDEGVAGQVVRTGHSLRIDDFSAWPQRIEQYDSTPWQTMLCVPLRTGDQILGAITLAQTEANTPFTPRDQQLMELFASQAAQAIEHAQRFERERVLRADAENSIAELRVALHELEQANDRIGRIEKLRMLGELASEVAHDFNNALVSILGNTQFLLLDENDPERITMLSSIEAAARDSVTMVKRIQEFGRAQQPSQTELVALNAIVRDAVTMTQARWRDKIVPTVALHARHTIRGNATELRRVLMNLIVNALDAMPHGGKLGIVTEDVGDMTRVTISDTGAGMPPHIQSRIFDPFFTTKAAGMGTGLGLAICHQIMTRHGGTITVESKEGQGTTFTLLLPAATAPAATPYDSLTIGPLSVLIYEPDPFLRAVLERFCEQHQCVPTVVESATGALEALRTQQYALGFLDVAGLESVAHCPTTSASYVVLLADESVACASCNPADEVLIKPITLAALSGVLLRAREQSLQVR